MFTVLICDKRIIDDCYHKYHIYLKPLLNNPDIALCSWDITGDTLDDALPGLKDLIRQKKDWRAVIVNDRNTWGFDAVNKRNPFDYVDSKKVKYNFTDYEQIIALRDDEERTVDKALSNPLTKLSIWLCGSPFLNKPNLCYSEIEGFFDNIDSVEAYCAKLDEYNLRISDVESDRIRDFRYNKINAIFDKDGELFNPPLSVLTVAERAKNVEVEEKENAWLTHTEFDYSQFYIDNLYPEKLRYLIYDIPYVKGEQSENHYFNFLTLLLTLAANDSPEGVLRSNRVYKVSMNVDEKRIKELCNKYNSKLSATLTKIGTIAFNLDKRQKEPVDALTVRETFESDVKVPVDTITHSSRSNLKANYDNIGLSKDCPGDEYDYWYNQYYSISKYFIRFLREPRRAIKTAAKYKFHSMNKIDDERASRLSEYQREDIQYALEEEERSMVSMVTSNVFNTEAYTQKMSDADKEIRRGIAQRMTKRKTLLVGLAAILAYLIGFFPLLISNWNNTKSLSFSFWVTVIVLVLFAVCGIVTLFVLRKRLINRFKHFNFVMSGILSEIESSLEDFSKYLSHACNFMRDYSALNHAADAYNEKQNTLNNHVRMIKDKISQVNILFSCYVDKSEHNIDVEEESYNFDFLQKTEYEYDMPYSATLKKVDYFQPGYSILTPIDFIDSVTLSREELYD